MGQFAATVEPNQPPSPDTSLLQAIIVCHPDACEKVFGQGRWQQIALRTDLSDQPIAPNDFLNDLNRYSAVEAIFSSWGMPKLSEEQLERLPNLKVLFYAAGSVQGFARPLLERGIVLVSAWRANAIPVAEFTLAQILLATKGYFRNVSELDGRLGSQKRPFHGPGNYGETVALLGAGAIGRTLIGMLRPFHLRVIVFDPFLTEAAALSLGVEKVSLSEAFKRGYVVSNHLADKDELAGIIDGALLRRLRPNATFINTGRGRTVNQPELIQILRQRPDLTALLDVTHPEPPPPGCELFDLPNVRVSSHIAGSIGDETLRMARYLHPRARPLCGE